MKRLLLLSFVCLTAVAAVGCRGGAGSRCRLFSSGFRGAPCNTCTPAPVCNPCAAPVYSQSMPVYGGDCGCCGGGDFGGFSSGIPMGVSSGCSSCGNGFSGGMQYTPGMVIPGEGMIMDGSGQIPSLPGGTLSPQTVPAPQGATPGPAGS